MATITPTINTIFNDLDQYRSFCQEYGYRFNERDLYNARSHVYKQFLRLRSGKSARDQWAIDAANFKTNVTANLAN